MEGFQICPMHVRMFHAFAFAWFDDVGKLKPSGTGGCVACAICAILIQLYHANPTRLVTYPRPCKLVTTCRVHAGKQRAYIELWSTLEQVARICHGEHAYGTASKRLIKDAHKNGRTHSTLACWACENAGEGLCTQNCVFTKAPDNQHVCPVDFDR